MSLKSILLDVGTKLLTGSALQKVASLTIAIGIAGQLYNYFQQMLDQAHSNFNQLQNTDYSSYLISYMGASGLPEGITIIVGALAFAMTWRITYELKPKAK